MISMQKMLGKMIQEHVVKPLMNDSCGLRDEELMAIAQSFCHIEKNIAETCHMCNDCDPKTLKRWEDDPEINFPKYHKGVGDKHYYWCDEVEIWKMSHQDILDRVDQKKRIV